MGIKQKLAKIIGTCLISCTALSLDAAVLFFDDFDRPDAPQAGGAWATMSNNLSDDLAILNNKLINPTTAVTNNIAGITTSVFTPGDLRVQSSIGHTQSSATDNRFSSSFGIRSQNLLNTGYSLTFSRSGSTFNNSGVNLYDNGSFVGQIASTFQYGDAIDVDFTFFTDGRVAGTVEGDGNTFSFAFGPRIINSTGSLFAIQMESRDNRNGAAPIYPSIDHVTLSGPAAVPEPSTYALLGLALVGMMAYRKKNKKA